METLRLLSIAFLGFVTSLSYAQEQSGPKPTELLIGRLSYFDMGPPFNYLDVIRVRESGQAVRVERVLLSPHGDCFQPAKAEFGSGELRQSISELMSGVDACHISDKQIKHESKRRKKFSVFSGVNVTMQFQCPSGPRVITSAVLDRDLYAAHPDTPQVTSWTMGLLNKLDAVLGPGAKDKPILQLEDQKPSSAKEPMQDFAGRLESGGFDSLFPSSADLPSAIYAESKKPVHDAEIKLSEIKPEQPDEFLAPKYPPIAKAARIEGEVAFQLRVAENCAVGDVSISSGPRILHQTVIDTLKQWKFCRLPAGAQVEGKFIFELNCQTTVNTSVSQAQ